MWDSINHFFRPITIESTDNVNFLKHHYEQGRVFTLFRFGIYVDTFTLNEIYITPWNKPVVCTKIIPTRDITEANIESRHIGKDRVSIFKSYGPYDYVEFSPIYSTVFFNITYNSETSELELFEPGIIHKDEFFLFTPALKENDKLKWIKYFEGKDIESMLFIPVAVNYDYLKVSFTLTNLTDIQFILCSTSYIRPFNSEGIINKNITSQYTDITTYDKLRALLTSSRRYSEEV